ncbi:hypothetical protein IV487_14395 [Enterococcus saccharolyticus]|uniref:hypothetical protein n=1 Tax=Enterococcus TaxID=1350 RepID=UPI001E6170CC|nr:hypothetical protein [Enterococcus saccharolyticus]MCD5003651.1 hypothetical protein [Enterococcus saccharolyticus]
MSIIEKINNKISTGFDTIDLIISLSNKEEPLDVNEHEKLKTCGRWVQARGHTLRVHTKLSAQQLADLIDSNTNVSKSEFTITNAAGLFIPFT